MMSAIPITVLADVLPCFRSHDKLVALDALRRVSTLVLSGARRDHPAPATAKRIAVAVPGADLVVVPNAGTSSCSSAQGWSTSGCVHVISVSAELTACESA